MRRADHPRYRPGWELVASGTTPDGGAFESWENRALLDQFEREERERKRRSREIAAWAKRAAEAAENERRNPTLVRCSCPFACFVHGVSVPWGRGPC